MTWQLAVFLCGEEDEALIPSNLHIGTTRGQTGLVEFTHLRVNVSRTQLDLNVYIMFWKPMRFSKCQRAPGVL